MKEQINFNYSSSEVRQLTDESRSNVIPDLPRPAKLGEVGIGPRLDRGLDSRSPIGVEDKFRGNDNVEGLTTRSFPSTLERKGNIFMDQRQNEKPPRQLKANINKPVSSEVLPTSPFTKSPEQILDPGLRNYATAFQTKLDERPLGDWKTEELKKEYLNLHKLTSEVERRTPDMTGKEKAAAETQPYRELLTEELERRETDLTELFFEALKFSGETGKTRSVGAVTRNLADYSDPILRNIVQENNNEVARVVEGNPLDPEFIIRQTQRVRSLLDEGSVDANEAIRLLGDLNSWFAEARGAVGERRYGIFGQRELTEEERETVRAGTDLEAIERLFNRMFDRVDVKPKVQFEKAFGSAGQYEYEEFIRVLNEVVANDGGRFSQGQVDRASDLVRRYAEEIELREITHNANYVVVANLGTEQLVNFVQSFDTGLADLAFSKEGVVEAYHFHEQALLKIREENGGYIPPYEVVGEPGKEIKGRLEFLVKKYMDERFGVGENATLADWQKNRAISIARGMSVITGRTIEIAASSRLPEEPGQPMGPRFGSMYAQNIIQDIAPFRHLIYKYNIGENRNRVFAYLLNRNKKNPWSKEELKAFDHVARIDLINNLVGDEEERFLGSLNPWKVGGIFSRTTWRVGEDPVVGALGDFVKDPANREWVGTGVTIEVERGNLSGASSTRALTQQEIQDYQLEIQRYQDQYGRQINTRGDLAEARIRWNLEKVASSQPLKLYFNMRDIQDTVLRRLFEARISLGVIQRTDLLYDRETGAAKIINESTIRRDLTSDERYKESSSEFIPEFKAEVDQMITELDNTVDSLVLLQDHAVNNRITDLRELNPTDPNLLMFINTVRDGFGDWRINEFITNLRDREWKLPFNLGTDDAPFNEYKFVRGGLNAISRRWNDMKAAHAVTGAVGELVENMDSFKTQEPIVAQIRKIYFNVKQIDETLARDIVMKVAEGVMKYYKKDWYARLPAGVGTLFNVTGRHSFAELAFGKGQMSWDEADLNGFTRLLRDQGLITEDQQHELQGKAGGTRVQTVEAYARLLTPIILLALTYYVLKESAEVVTERRR